MKAEEKLPFVYNHTELIEEAIGKIKKSIKWIESDIKVVKKYSKTDKTAK